MEEDYGRERKRVKRGEKKKTIPLEVSRRTFLKGL
jgi:hypothetical protein